ncbi:MAG: hypothetical protein Q9181_005560 [Wetmoreana brouardii]
MFPRDLILGERSLVNLEQEFLVKALRRKGPSLKEEPFFFFSHDHPADSKNGHLTPANRELPRQYKIHIRTGSNAGSGFHPRWKRFLTVSNPRWKKLLIVLTAVAALQKGTRRYANGKAAKKSGMSSLQDVGEPTMRLPSFMGLGQHMLAADKNRSNVPPFTSDGGMPGSANTKADESESLPSTFASFFTNPIHRDSEGSQRLTGSEVSQSINAPLIQVFDQQTMRKRRLFTDAEKEHVRKIRKHGACLECKQKKVKSQEVVSVEPHFATNAEQEKQSIQNFNAPIAMSVQTAIEGNMSSGDIWSEHTRRSQYNAYYNAAAHLRRVHFKRPSLEENRTDKTSTREGYGGGDWPPMDVLRKFMREIEVGNEDGKEPENEVNTDVGIETPHRHTDTGGALQSGTTSDRPFSSDSLNRPRLSSTHVADSSLNMQTSLTSTSTSVGGSPAPAIESSLHGKGFLESTRLFRRNVESQGPESTTQEAN